MTLNNAPSPACTLVTGKFRMAFPSLITPKKNDKGEDRWEVVMLFDADSPTVLELGKAIAAAMTDKFGPDKEKWPKEWRKPLRKGDDFDPKYKDSHFGKIVVSASNRSQPNVVGADPKVAVTDEKQIYGGRWARAHIRAYYYDTKGNKGVTFALNHLQLLENDTPFGNRTRAEDVFDKVESGTAQATAADDFFS
jgi:hypothetical protein